ncbi:NUDIX hydrolase [Mangrovactinospora gilvigrisea]|uniref:NUDIX hydrolase n=1 Tax=Mangrovactinospora gilvigrisea TaxID=1428644 RepID=UPI001FE576A9|nr:NUDIX domain-containing protein [Mangrovactinospora gilvigrisea]
MCWPLSLSDVRRSAAKPQRPHLDALIILEREEKVLLALRAGTGYRDGWYNLPSGKAVEGEDIITAAVRETREEIGIHLTPSQLQTVHVLHHYTPEHTHRICWFLRATEWTGEPVNAEPHKCADLLWAPTAALPANTVPYNAAGIRAYLADIPFSLHGWPTAPDLHTAEARS